MNLFQTHFFNIRSILLALSLFTLISCEENEPEKESPMPIDYGYGIDIISPIENAPYFLGDTLPVSINFLSHTGEIVHYISVDIYSEQDKSIQLYSVDVHQHVPDSFTFADQITLRDTSKITADSVWILEAKLWSHDLEPDTVARQKNINIKG